MLNDLLGWIVVLGSLGLYLSRFFLPEVQRKNDAIWSGIGLFYALILWTNGDRIKGGLLLGQMASVALIVWLGWQTLQQRRQLTASQDRTPLPESVQSSWPFAKQGFDRLVSTIKEGPSTIAETSQESVAEKKEFKMGGLTIPLDLSGLLAPFKGSPSRETAAIPKASSADAKDEDWGDEEVSAPDTPTEPESAPVAEVTNESQAPDVVEAAVSSEAAIASNEPEQSVEPLKTEEPSTQADESTETSNAEAIAEPEADQNQPSGEADLSVDHSTEETVETSSETPKEDSVASAEAMQSEQETSSELEAEAVAHTPAPETDDGSWPPQDPVT
jgi:Ycf66 protein N-terminus